ncbi:MAG: hypothetical protein ACOH1T_12410 [Microbacteriaceae bacterium]
MFRRPKNRTIVPQYAAYPGIGVIAAAELLGDGKRAIAAQLVDFAVRKVVTIARPAGAGKRAGFTVTLAAAGLAEGPDEKAILVTLFGNDLVPGASFRLEMRRNRELGATLKAPHRWIVARLVDGGLARENGLLSKLATPWRTEPIVPTQKGLPIVDHLWGVHDYIELAEKERFAMLQSPDGALRSTPVAQLEVLVLYEKLLPYAVLFGLEKQWMRELDLRHRDLPPDMAATLLELADVGDFVVHGIELVATLSDLAHVVDVADAADGLGAVFGGIGEFLGNLEFPDFG